MYSDLNQERWVEPDDLKAPLLAGIDSDDEIYSWKQSFDRNGKRKTIEEEISQEELQRLKMMHKVRVITDQARCKDWRVLMGSFHFNERPCVARKRDPEAGCSSHSCSLDRSLLMDPPQRHRFFECRYLG